MLGSQVKKIEMKLSFSCELKCPVVASHVMSRIVNLSSFICIHHINVFFLEESVMITLMTDEDDSIINIKYLFSTFSWTTCYLRSIIFTYILKLR